jgi:hypothetical protein
VDTTRESGPGPYLIEAPHLPPCVEQSDQAAQSRIRRAQVITRVPGQADSCSERSRRHQTQRCLCHHLRNLAAARTVTSTIAQPARGPSRWSGISMSSAGAFTVNHT